MDFGISARKSSKTVFMRVDKTREFQIFAKPAGPQCNLACSYCYYLDKKSLYPGKQHYLMSDDILEKYIIHHIEASTEPLISFSWHGGEPLIAGLEFFKRVIELQSKFKPLSQKIINGIQTNGTMINDDWCLFLAKENFIVGLSLDGPEELHNLYRLSKNNAPSFQNVFRAYKLLQKYNIICEILCVVNVDNVKYPLEVYQFFKQLGLKYMTFLPLVVPDPQSSSRVSKHSVPSVEFGIFLSTIFNEWLENDIGKIKIQIFEEAARTAFKQDHTLCIFKETCGGVPVVEHNGDFYSCDHYVDKDHYLGNLTSVPLVELLDSNKQKNFGLEKLTKLPDYCLSCEFRDMCNGECPKNRFIKTPDGQPGLNYLCEGYKLFFANCKPFVEAISNEWNQNKQ